MNDPNKESDDSKPSSPSLLWRMLQNIGNGAYWFSVNFMKGFWSGLTLTIFFDFAAFYGIRWLLGDKLNSSSKSEL